jgi:hypothetical protein
VGVYIVGMSMIPHCLDNRLRDGGGVVSLTRQKYLLVLISGRLIIEPRVMVVLEGLGKLKIMLWPQRAVGCGNENIVLCHQRTTSFRSNMKSALNKIQIEIDN